VAVVHDAGWAQRWQRSWDRLEENLVPDRELRIRALLDVVEAIAGRAPTVLDLACGTAADVRVADLVLLCSGVLDAREQSGRDALAAAGITCRLARIDRRLPMR
jgi:hypothetical protein